MSAALSDPADVSALAEALRAPLLRLSRKLRQEAQKVGLSAQDALILGYVGRLSGDKLGEALLRAFAAVLREDCIVEAFVNSALIATLATVFSLLVTVSSGYMLSRFTGPASRIWFGTIYVFRCVPYISWVLPLYFVTQSWGIYDTYLGLLLPHVAVHICFFSWLMKGFFDGIDPSMEYAAMIDGCTRWGAFIRVAVPSALPAISALAVLCWLFTWNEFLFALILTGNRVPMITVVMAQFVTEMGLRWNLMAATAVMALLPAFLIALFGQKYVIRGLRI